MLQHLDKGDFRDVSLIKELLITLGLVPDQVRAQSEVGLGILVRITRLLL